MAEASVSHQGFSPSATPSKQSLAFTSSSMNGDLYDDFSAVITSNGASSSVPRSLSLKISRLLTANLNDDGTRAALDTLDDFGLASQTHNSYASTSQGIGDARSLKTRRLRAEVDRRLLDDSNRFLAAFKSVNDQLEDLQEHLSSMQTVVDTVEAQLKTANSGTKHLLASATTLRAERLATADRHAIMTVFLQRFTLNDREIAAMTSREVPVGREMFDAISRTERIRLDCKSLMIGDNIDEAKAGTDIMSITSQYLEAAYSKLHRYASFAARNYTTRPEVLDNVSPTLRKSLQLLKTNRSDFFDNVLSTLSSTRSIALSNMFLQALTKGSGNSTSKGKATASSSNTTKPIELHAHDPIRYVGDILAWVHQAMASEREFLENLFGLKDSGRFVGQARPVLDLASPAEPLVTSPLLSTAGSLSDEARLRSLLDQNLEGCGRPLRTRIQQTVKSNAMISAISTYQVFQLLQFYRVLMQKVMGPAAQLVNILGDLATFANQAFFETIREQARSLLQNVQTPGLDLKPPAAVRDAMGTLREIMQAHSHGLLDEEDMSSLESFDDVLDTAINPIHNLIGQMKKMKPSEFDQCIFECNCLTSLQQTLQTFNFATKHQQDLDSRLQSTSSRLTDIHYASIAKESGFETLEGQIGSENDTTNEDVLKGISITARTFDAFLTRVDPSQSPRLALVSSPKVAAEVHQAALQRLAAAYEKTYASLAASAVSMPLQRTPKEVHMLLTL